MRRILALALALGASALAATLPSRAVLSGTCCPGAVWTPDSRALLFLDGPPARASTGIYQVPAAGGPVTRRFSSVAFFSPRLLWAVRPSTGEATVVERLADGRRFTVPTYGADVTWNRAETRLAYTRSATTGNFDRRATRIFVADVFAAPRQVATVYGGGIVGWVNDRTLLLTGKRNPADRDRDLFTLDTRTGARGTLASTLFAASASVRTARGWPITSPSTRPPATACGCGPRRVARGLSQPAGRECAGGGAALRAVSRQLSASPADS